MKLSHLAVSTLNAVHPRLMYEVVRKQIGRTVPFARKLGVEISHMDADRAASSLPQTPELNNHVGTFHAGVIYTACESASGAALAGALLPAIMKARFVVREARIHYSRPARGRIDATAALAKPSQAVLDDLEMCGRCEVPIDVRATVLAADGCVEEVATATFLWHVRNPAK